jgi:mono/diheme cytochrome c family protein
MTHLTRTMAILAGAAALAACNAENPAPSGADAPDDEAETVSLKPAGGRVVDPALGKTLFVEKGCVICHAVNGVGGKAAPPLDAEIGAPPVDPLDFAARMWRGAPAMIELQSIELGYTIYLTADEMANLAAFAGDREAQKSLALEDLPENIAAGLLDERFWEMENWDQFLREGQEGDFPEDVEDVPADPQ